MRLFSPPSLRLLARRAHPPWQIKKKVLLRDFAAANSSQDGAIWDSLVSVTPVLSGNDLEDYIREGVANFGEHMAWMQSNVDSGITKDMWSLESQTIFMQLRNTTLKEHEFDAKEFLSGASQAFRVITEATMDQPPDADADGSSVDADEGGGGSSSSGSGGSSSGGAGNGGRSGSSGNGSGAIDEPKVAVGSTQSQAEGASGSLDAATAAAAAKDAAEEMSSTAAAKGSDASEGSGNEKSAEGKDAAEAKDSAEAKSSADAEDADELEPVSAEAKRTGKDALLREALSPRIYELLTGAIAGNTTKGTRLILLDLHVESARLTQASCFIYRNGKLRYGVRPEDREADASDGEKALAVMDVEFRYRQRVRAEKDSGDELFTRSFDDKQSTWRFAAFLEDPQWRVVHIM